MSDKRDYRDSQDFSPTTKTSLDTAVEILARGSMATDAEIQAVKNSLDSYIREKIIEVMNTNRKWMR